MLTFDVRNTAHYNDEQLMGVVRKMYEVMVMREAVKDSFEAFIAEFTEHQFKDVSGEEIQSRFKNLADKIQEYSDAIWEAREYLPKSDFELQMEGCKKMIECLEEVLDGIDWEE